MAPFPENAPRDQCSRRECHSNVAPVNDMIARNERRIKFINARPCNEELVPNELSWKVSNAANALRSQWRMSCSTLGSSQLRCSRRDNPFSAFPGLRKTAQWSGQDAFSKSQNVKQWCFICWIPLRMTTDRLSEVRRNVGKIAVANGFRLWLDNVRECCRQQTGAHVINGSGTMIEWGMLRRVPVTVAIAPRSRDGRRMLHVGRAV